MRTLRLKPNKFLLNKLIPFAVLIALGCILAPSAAWGLDVIPVVDNEGNIGYEPNHPGPKSVVVNGNDIPLFCDYYIDTDSIGGPASDSNPGTIAQPWKTISKANTALTAGKTVCLRGGTYETSVNAIAPKNSGTGINNLITYRNHFNEEVILKGEGIYESGGYSWALVNILNDSYIQVEGIILENPKEKWFQIEQSNHIIFKDVTCKNLTDYGSGFSRSAVYDSDYVYFEGLYISGSDVFEEYDALILKGATSIVFYDSYFGNATHQAVGTSHWNHLSGDVYVALINCTIENKYHTGVGMHMIGHHFLTQGCIFKNHGIKPDQQWQDWHGCGNGDPGYYTVGRRQIVRYNTFYNNSKHFSFRPVAGTPFAYNWFYHNTLYNTHSTVMEGCTPVYGHGVPAMTDMWKEGTGFSFNNVHFFNNILWNRGENLETGRNVLMWFRAVSGTTLENNYFHDNIIGDINPSHSTRIFWKTTYYDGIDNINTIPDFYDNIDIDPLFIAPDNATPNFNLQEGSSAINQGKPITNATNNGINSNNLTVKPEHSYAFYSKKTWEHDWILNPNIKSDLIKIGSGNPVRIDTISYDNGTIILTETRSWNQNDPVYYCYNDQCYIGTAPDIGAYEYGVNQNQSSATDLNQDGRTDIQDIQLCVNVILETETDPDIVARADVNKDGSVNTLDMQEIVNVILG